MANGLMIFFLLGLLLLSKVEPRPVPESDPSVSSSSTPIRLPSPGEPSLEDDEDACKGLNSEECLMRRSMVAHTDYIYTQDISSTGP